MAENSKIEWTDHTFNPWIGCTKVSPACDGCYAENLMANRYQRVQWGPGEDRQRTGEANWRKPIAWNKAAQAAGMRPFVFCSSLADVFDNEVDEKWRYDLMNLIEATPNLIWLLLTKRIGNVVRMTDPARGHRMLPRNVAIGATIANDEEYERDSGKLWAVKQTLEPLFTFGSFEPLLGRVTLGQFAPDWIIAGGETDQGSHKARETPTEHFRHLRDKSREFGRAFFMKQMTRKAPIPDDLLIRQWPIARAA
ncbi:DUF5131 family protein [Rhizobium sp. 11515TR]|uniref:DUF5131 family protein n=1 Tax=Rhizobium sp. 11515TR TaxID=2028343 RepID=UPI000BA8A6D0|nr:DUF5131 family protein [Rhizobium sp. 11515TR]ASW06258.1 hypothetical protein CKA34_10435 [Rhizobium sp. 11515TR]